MAAPTVLLVVPAGTARPEPLAAAISALHPDWRVVALWSGDPQQRPLPGEQGAVAWIDDDLGAVDHAGRSWEHVLVARVPLETEWRRALAAVRALHDRGADPIVALWAGEVAVLDRLDALLAAGGTASACTVVARTVAGVVDGDVVHTRVAVFGRAATSPGGPVDEMLARLDAQWDEDDPSLGDMLATLAVRDDVAVCATPGVGVGTGRWEQQAPALVVLPGFDPGRPWVLDPTVGVRPRIDVHERADIREALERAGGQLAGSRTPLRLPGGLAVDATMRAVVRSEVATARGAIGAVERAGATGQRSDAPVPLPWTQAREFREWLGGRYWATLHDRRRDLAVAFPDPFGADADAYRRWAAGAWTADDIGLALPPPERSVRQWSVHEPLRIDGLDIVGYVTRESSLGDVARRLGRALDAARVDSTMLAYERTASPLMPDPPAVSERLEHRVALAVVNADQFPALRADHPELFRSGPVRAGDRRLVGYWFWELAHVPPAMRRAVSLVDEIWAGSRFVVDAFAEVSPVPVRHVPIPVPEPVVSARARDSFPVLASAGDRMVFGVVLDHFSVTERKNPLAAIAAFRHAFAPDEGPMLVVKTINGDRRWPQHAELRAAAADRPDIVVWDAHLSRADHMAFIRALDVLVSLHRSEGLGLHLAEAMWLGVPVVATAYSGNLDLMDDTCAELVPARLIPVDPVRGEGVYPAGAQWADPDLDAAAAAMRRLVDDPARRAAVIEVALRRMAAQPSLADTGAAIAAHVERLARG